MNASFIALTALLALGCTSHTLLDARDATGNQPHGISVTGFGEASGVPTIARINVGVEARAVDAAQAIDQANSRMRAVLAALAKSGVAPADLQTSNLSLNFERTNEPPFPPEPPPVRALPAPAPAAPPAKPGVSGKAEPAPAQPPVPAPPSPVAWLPDGFYRASNTVLVTIRDLGRIGDVLGVATGAGADQMFGIEFKIEDPTKLEAQAREKAVADAQARATQLAQLAGLKLGRPISIVENPNRVQPEYGYSLRQAMMSKVPVEHGSVAVNTSVQVIYELAK
jgi:uncharacterized protein YggE